MNGFFIISFLYNSLILLYMCTIWYHFAHCDLFPLLFPDISPVSPNTVP